MEENNGKVGTILRIVAVAVVAVFIGALIIFNAGSTKPSDEIWDTKATLGNVESSNHFVMYTDIMCPYCDYFSRALMDDWDEAKKFIEENNIVFEVRMTDFLWEYNGVSKYSTAGAEATICAKNEDRFWDYYHAALKALNDDYHSKGMGNSHDSAPITDMPDDYWVKIGKGIGLGGTFEDCVNNHAALKEVQDNTKKTAKALEKNNISGLPFFHFGNFKTSGYDTSWGWEDGAKKYFEAGLKAAK
ncbi:MAG: thioredoxin domain-containing protein [Candidatus Saccharibacteria bacterium]|nr:thioredoxin domain-containing protein [Candidatus Saccharibacteria bacterium]